MDLLPTYSVNWSIGNDFSKNELLETCSCRLGFSSMGRNDESKLFFDGSNLKFEDSRG